MHPERFGRQLGIIVGAIIVLTLVACNDDGGGARVVGQDGSTIEITRTATTATPSADVSPTIVPSEGSPTPSVTPEASETATPDGTSTPTATRTPGSTNLDESEGVPYSTSDFEASLPANLVVEAGPADEALCPDTSVAETTLRVGGDEGSIWALWVYPDSAAREADWEFSDGALVAQSDDCDLPTGLNYFNANTVLVVREVGDGIDEMRDAFLSMSVESEPDSD